MLVIGMELRDIEYFTVVAQHGHLGRAAEALELSQPALSKSLRRLEHELGAKLVKRTPKGVELSAEGMALLTRARELHLSVQAVAEEIRDVSRGRVGHVRIGAGPMSAAEMLVESLLPLLGEAPKVSFNIVVSDNDLMIPALRRGDLDLIVGFAPRALPRDGLVEELLFEVEFVVIASASHPLAARKVLTVADITKERWVLSESSLLTQQRLRRTFLERGLSAPDVAVETRSLRLRLQLIASFQSARLHLAGHVSLGKERPRPDGATRSGACLASSGKRDLSRGCLYVPCNAPADREHQDGLGTAQRVVTEQPIRHAKSTFSYT